MTTKPYGYELILDLQGCDPKTFNRDSIERYMVALCDEIKMERRDLHFWDNTDLPTELQMTSPHTQGTSAVQFIITSSIVIHALELTGEVFVNIFSCKEFDPMMATNVTVEWFGAQTHNCRFLTRG